MSLLNYLHIDRFGIERSNNNLDTIITKIALEVLTEKCVN